MRCSLIDKSHLWTNETVCRHGASERKLYKTHDCETDSSYFHERQRDREGTLFAELKPHVLELHELSFVFCSLAYFLNYYLAKASTENQLPGKFSFKLLPLIHVVCSECVSLNKSENCLETTE